MVRLNLKLFIYDLYFYKQTKVTLIVHSSYWLFFSGLHILHDGPCTYKDTVFPKDVTQICHLADNHVIMMPVCGSNNVTYPNPYVLKCAQHRGVVSSGTSRICYAVLHVYRVFILITAFHRLSSMLLTSNTNRA